MRRAARFVDAAQAQATEQSVAEASIAVAEARAHHYRIAGRWNSTV